MFIKNHASPHTRQHNHIPKGRFADPSIPSAGLLPRKQFIVLPGRSLQSRLSIPSARDSGHLLGLQNETRTSKGCILGDTSPQGGPDGSSRATTGQSPTGGEHGGWSVLARGGSRSWASTSRGKNGLASPSQPSSPRKSSNSCKRNWPTTSTSRRATREHRFLLRGLVSCGTCRLTTGARTTDRGDQYYICRGRRDPLRRSQGHPCTMRYIPARQLDELVWNDLCQILLDPAQIASALERAQAGAWLPKATAGTASDACRKRYRAWNANRSGC
jgi:hypothetical protein